MIYCSLENLKLIIDEPTLIQLTDDNGTGEIDTAVVEESVMYSSVLVDGYIRGRYNLPLSETPKLLNFIALDLSIYRLYSRRLSTDMPESINEKYKNAIKTLTQIQKGMISLGIETSGTATDLGEFRTNKDGAKEFSKDKLSEY